MSLLGFGTSSNSLQANQQNSITNDLSFFFGDENKSGGKEFGGQTSTPTQTTKEELGLSASVGVLGGQGGPSAYSRGGNSTTDTKAFTDTKSVLGGLNSKLIYGAFGLGALFAIGYLWKAIKGK